MPDAAAPLAWQTVGPFFPAGLVTPDLADLARPGHAGEAIRLLGRVEDARGPFANAIVELRQADAAGRLPGEPGADPHFAHWGRAATDAAGRFAFRTVLPGPHADPAGPRAPCFDLLLLGAGIMRRLPTTFFLHDHPANAADPVLRAVPAERRALLLLSHGASSDGVRVCTAALRLAGAAETPFFLD